MKSPVAAVCLALLIQTAPALSEPGYWRVTGVAADDTLNVRKQPSASSADIGDLSPDATGIEVINTDASGDWGRIVWEDGNGWIAMRFLIADPQPGIGGTALPQGLLCNGTEPFWSVRLSGGGAVYSGIDGDAVALTLSGALTAEARGPFPVVVSHGAASAASMSIIEPAECSDGMSDRVYPWRVLFLLSTPDGQRLLDGCCQLPLEDGSH